MMLEFINIFDRVIWSNGFDNTIAIWFSNLFEMLPGFIQDIFVALSSLGDMGVFFILLGIVLLFFKKTRKVGIYCFLGVILALLINDCILKQIFQRARPYEDPELVKQLISVTNNGGLVPGIQPSSSSFPSGHTFMAFATFGGIMGEYIFAKEERKSWLPYFIFFLVFAVLMGLTRILLSHHYATDVIAGMLIGTLSGFGGYFLVKYTPTWYHLLKEKFTKKKEIESTTNQNNE